MYSRIDTLEEKVFEGLSSTLKVCAEIFQENKDEKRETSEWIMARNYVLGLRKAGDNIRRGVNDRQSDRLIEGLCENYHYFLEREICKEREKISRTSDNPLYVFVLMGYLGSLVSSMGGVYHILNGRPREAFYNVLITGATLLASYVIKSLIRIKGGVPDLVEEIKTAAARREALKDKSIMKNTICKRYAELESLMPEIV